MVTTPPETPVTTPDEVPMVARDVLLLAQVPPAGVQDKFVVDPTQTVNVPVIGPWAFAVK